MPSVPPLDLIVHGLLPHIVQLARNFASLVQNLVDDAADVLDDLVVAAIEREVQRLDLLVHALDARHQVCDVGFKLLLLVLRTEHALSFGLLVRHLTVLTDLDRLIASVLLLSRVNLEIWFNLLVRGRFLLVFAGTCRLQHHFVDVPHLLRLIAVEHLLVGSAVPQVWVAWIRPSEHEDHVRLLKSRVSVRVRHHIIESFEVLLLLSPVLIL